MPIERGHDHDVEFQPLGLVDGHDLDGARGAAIGIQIRETRPTRSAASGSPRSLEIAQAREHRAHVVRAPRASAGAAGPAEREPGALHPARDRGVALHAKGGLEDRSADAGSALAPSSLRSPSTRLIAQRIPDDGAGPRDDQKIGQSRAPPTARAAPPATRCDRRDAAARRSA